MKNEMAFIKLIRKRLHKPIIRVVFLCHKNKEPSTYTLSISIPVKLSEKLHIKNYDPISISYEKETRRLLLKNNKKGDGYLAKEISPKTFRVQLKWTMFTPTEGETKTYFVRHEFNEDGLVICL